MKLLQVVATTGLMALSVQVSAMTVQGVTAEARGSAAVQVSWEESADAAYYDLYQDSTLTMTGITDTTVDVTGLSTGTSYQFFVTACSADGLCSEASSQANVQTASEGSELGVCAASTDGSSPTVALIDNGDGTAVLSWCEVTEADGYNLYLGNEYQTTMDSSTFELTVGFSGSEQYQIAWYMAGVYPPKSAVASVDSVDPEPPVDELSLLEKLAMLDAASSANDTDVEIYFTRHAEKMTQLEEQEDGSFIEVCGEDKCAEVLNAKGELRAELLAELFLDAGITDRLTHAFSSHKIRTRQTIEQITADAGLTGDMDKYPDDGIQEFPVMNNSGTDYATELDPEGTSASEAPVIEALLSLPAGSVALVAGHSGTLYDIMSGLGLSDVCLEDTIDTCNENRYPISSSFKVKNFGDIWKVTLQDGVADFAFRTNLQPQTLSVDDLVE